MHMTTNDWENQIPPAWTDVQHTRYSSAQSKSDSKKRNISATDQQTNFEVRPLTSTRTPRNLSGSVCVKDSKGWLPRVNWGRLPGCVESLKEIVLKASVAGNTNDLTSVTNFVLDQRFGCAIERSRAGLRLIVRKRRDADKKHHETHPANFGNDQWLCGQGAGGDGLRHPGNCFSDWAAKVKLRKKWVDCWK